MARMVSTAPALQAAAPQCDRPRQSQDEPLTAKATVDSVGGGLQASLSRTSGED